MDYSHLLSRRNVSSESKVDFRPHEIDSGPYAELRRLQSVLAGGVFPPEDFKDMDTALDAFREYSYRKVFSGTTHDDFVKLDKSDPQRIDWLLAVAWADSAIFRSRKSNS